MSEWPLYLAVAIPVAFVLGHNLAVFIFVLRSLLKSRVKGKVTPEKSKELWQRLRQGISIMLLIGLTWMFGLFAIRSAEKLFAWLFVLFNSLQGIGIFIVFCMLQEDVRNTLKPYFSWIHVPERCLRKPTEDDSFLSTEKYTSKSEFSTSAQDSSPIITEMSKFDSSMNTANHDGVTNPTATDTIIMNSEILANDRLSPAPETEETTLRLDEKPDYIDCPSTGSLPNNHQHESSCSDNVLTNSDEERFRDSIDALDDKDATNSLQAQFGDEIMEEDGALQPTIEGKFMATHVAEETMLVSDEKPRNSGSPSEDHQNKHASSDKDLANSEAESSIDSIETNDGKDDTNLSQNEIGNEISEEEINLDSCEDVKEN